MVRVFIEKERTTIEKQFTGTAGELCALVGVTPETVLIVQDGTLLTEEDVISGEKVELLSVVSGG